MKRIGFDKAIKLEWMDELAFTFEKKDQDKVLSHVRKIIAKEIEGKESQRKHLTVLKRIWFKIPKSQENLRDRAIKLAVNGESKERLVVYWGMSLLAFPFFRDTATIVGNLTRLQNDFTLKQVRQRIVEEWGDRTTIEFAIPRLLKSFLEWGVLEKETTGKYKASSKIDIGSKNLLLWLIECYFYSIEERIIYLEKLNKIPSLFPFSYQVTAGDLFGTGIFEVNRQGLGNDVVEIKRAITKK